MDPDDSDGIGAVGPGQVGPAGGPGPHRVAEAPQPLAGAVTQPEVPPASAGRLLRPRPLSPAAFARYGQVIGPVEDGAVFGPDDAQLELSAGQPRFYVMRVGLRPGLLQNLARHQRCSQCLASADHHPWWLAVAPAQEPRLQDLPSDLELFAIPPGLAIKLHRGTWHGGPFHGRRQATFFNLELSDTNQTDRQLWTLPQALPLALEVPPQWRASSRQPQ